MTGRRHCICALALLTALALGLLAGNGRAQSQGRAQSKGFAYSFELSGEINGDTKRLLDRALEQAKNKRARLVIMRLDTPGGEGSAMMAMIRSMTAARLPVVVYVAPDGARAASAGVFVTMGSDVAAMATQTNIGSASTIFIGPAGLVDVPPAFYRRVINESVTYIRGLAHRHGRNADLAERMVRKATNVTAATARRAGLVDVVAESEAALLKRLDGFRIRGRKAQVLRTAGLRVVHSDPLTKAEESTPGEGALLFGLGLPGLISIGMLTVLIAVVPGRLLWRRRPRLFR